MTLPIKSLWSKSKACCPKSTNAEMKTSSNSLSVSYQMPLQTNKPLVRKVLIYLSLGHQLAKSVEIDYAEVPVKDHDWVEIFFCKLSNKIEQSIQDRPKKNLGFC